MNPLDLLERWATKRVAKRAAKEAKARLLRIHLLALEVHEENYKLLRKNKLDLNDPNPDLKQFQKAADRFEAYQAIIYAINPVKRIRVRSRWGIELEYPRAPYNEFYHCDDEYRWVYQDRMKPIDPANDPW